MSPVIIVSPFPRRFRKSQPDLLWWWFGLGLDTVLAELPPGTRRIIIASWYPRIIDNKQLNARSEGGRCSDKVGCRGTGTPDIMAVAVEVPPGFTCILEIKKYGGGDKGPLNKGNVCE